MKKDNSKSDQNIYNLNNFMQNNGDGSWSTPTNFGSGEFFFVEDNVIGEMPKNWPNTGHYDG
jgi:hypothetical protein